MSQGIHPDEIKAQCVDNPKVRERDLAAKLEISEAVLVAAHVGDTVTRIDAHPDGIVAAAQELDEVLALTRNESCVNEKVGVYDNYHSGAHASMVLAPEIDLRIFPSHWQHAFMVEKQTDEALRRSIQVFDAAGDAVHKIYLRNEDSFNAWSRIADRLRSDNQSQVVAVTPRVPPEAPKADIAKVDILRREWKAMTDTHQFMRLTSKLKMNRLGAYRIAGEPFVRALAISSLGDALQEVVGTDIAPMIFTGNRGCIQIHSGPIKTLRSMGPWQNIMDPSFNLHLRTDHISEVWAVEKPTQRGPALSIEAFDTHGALIAQIFAVGKDGQDSRLAWAKVIASLPSLTELEVV